MQVVTKSLFFIFLFWFAMLFFMPKKEMYYSLETVLAKQGIEINEKRIEEGVFTLTLYDAAIYVKGIRIAKIEKIRLATLLFYTKLYALNLEADDSLKQFIPQKIDKVVAVYSVLSPLNISLKGLGDFGLAEGSVNLKTQELRIDLPDIKKVGALGKVLKKDDQGWYYETSF